MNPFDHVLSVRIKGDADGPQTGDVVLDGSSLHDWAENEDYKAGDVVVYNSQLWQANEDFTSGDNWDPSYWTQIGIPDIILPGFEAFHQYQQYQVIAQAGKIWRAKVAFQSNAAFDENDWEGLSGSSNTYTSADGTVTITFSDETVDYSVKAWTDNIVNDFNTALNDKVDKISGKTLTTNDFSNPYKNKLDGLQNITEIGNNLVLNDGRLDAGFTISFDTTLNPSSTNAVQNRVVAEQFGNVDLDITDLKDRATALESTTSAHTTQIGTISGNITTLQAQVAQKANAGDLSTVATSGDYNDLLNKPDEPGNGILTLKLSDNSTSVGSFTANQTSDTTWRLPAAAADIELTMDSNFVLTAQLKDQFGNDIGIEQQINLPLETFVVDGEYDAVNKKLILTLESGTQIEIDVADLVDGLQKELEVAYDSANLMAKLEEKS